MKLMMRQAGTCMKYTCRELLLCIRKVCIYIARNSVFPAQYMCMLTHSNVAMLQVYMYTRKALAANCDKLG